MSNNKGRNLRFMLRTLLVLAAGFIISVILLTGYDTYSWFVSTLSGSARVTAASAEDIIDISNVEFVYDSEWSGDSQLNPIAIRIRKAGGLDYSPVVFFGVRGDAREYVLHINPVKLSGTDYYTIPIVTDVNVRKHQNLSSGDDKNNKDNDKADLISGTITINYLNQYLCEEFPFSFTKEYLRYRLNEEIIKEQLEPAEPENIQVARAAVVYSPKLKAYQSIRSDMESTAIKAISILTEELELNSINTGSEEKDINDIQLFKAAYYMSKDQELLIDIIFPGLRDYIGRLLGYAESLEVKLAEKDTIIQGLTQEIAALAEKLSELESENAGLKSEIDSLNAVLQGMAVIPPPPANTAVPPVTAPGDNGTAAPPDGGSSNPPLSGDSTAPIPQEPSETGEPVAQPPTVEEPVVNPPVVEEPVNEHPSGPADTGEAQAPGEDPAEEGSPATETPEEAPAIEEAPAEEAPPQESPSDEGPEGPADTNDNSTPADSDTVDNLIENPVIEMDGEL